MTQIRSLFSRVHIGVPSFPDVGAVKSGYDVKFAVDQHWKIILHLEDRKATADQALIAVAPEKARNGDRPFVWFGFNHSQGQTKTRAESNCKPHPRAETRCHARLEATLPSPPV